MTLARPVALAVLAVLAVGLALGAALVACGSSKSGGPSSGDASTDGAAADGGGDTGPATTGVGVLTFSQDPDAGGTFFGGFSETAPPLAANCTQVDAGACLTTSCTAQAAGDGGGAPADAGPTTAPNAGVLTLTGGVFGSAGALVAPDKGGTYLYASPGRIFSAGDTLGVSGAGDAVPAFPAQTVTVLPVLALAFPASDGGKLTIPTSQPLTVTWTGGQVGAKAILSATAVFTTGGVAGTTCAWDATLGTGTVPAAALKPLAAANASTSGLSWYQETDNTFTVGTLAVTLSARVARGSLASFQ